MDNLRCPKCGRALDQIVEEYNSLSTYQYNGNRFIWNDLKEQYSLKCPYCNSPLPKEVAEEIQKALPKV